MKITATYGVYPEVPVKKYLKNLNFVTFDFKSFNTKLKFSVDASPEYGFVWYNEKFVLGHWSYLGESYIAFGSENTLWTKLEIDY